MGLLTAACAPAAWAGTPDQLSFEALRNGHRIGRQETRFERRGDAVTVRTVAEMSVGLGPVVLYRYRHEATERWTGDAFESLVTRTNQNGRWVAVSAQRGSGGVAIRAADGTALNASPQAVPFSHWNRAIASRPLFNPQDGKLLRVTSAAPQPASTLLADGQRIAVTRIRFLGEAQIDDDYDQAQAWAGLQGKLKDGSKLEYRRL